jgi:hypothetical protein
MTTTWEAETWAPARAAAGQRNRDKVAPIDVIVAERTERKAAPQIKMSQLDRRASLEVASQQAHGHVIAGGQGVQHGVHAGQDAVVRMWNRHFARQVLQIGVAQHAHGLARRLPADRHAARQDTMA